MNKFQACLFTSIGWGIALTIFTRLVVFKLQSQHLSEIEIGQIFSAFDIISILYIPLMSQIYDITKMTRTIMLIGVALSAIVLYFLFSQDINDKYLFIKAFVIQNLFKVLKSTDFCFRSLIISSLDYNLFDQSIVYSATSISYGLSAAIGSFLEEQFQNDQWIIQYMYAGSSILSIIAGIFIDENIQKDDSKINIQSNSEPEEVLDIFTVQQRLLFKDYSNFSYFLSLFFIGGTETFIQTISMINLKEIGTHDQVIGLSILMGEIFQLPMSLLFEQLYEQLGFVWLTIIGHSVIILRLFLQSIISNGIYSICIESLKGISQVLCFTTYLVWISRNQIKGNENKSQSFGFILTWFIAPIASLNLGTQCNSLIDWRYTYILYALINFSIMLNQYYSSYKSIIVQNEVIMRGENEQDMY